MEKIITPQFWVTYDEDAPSDSGMYTKEKCIMINDRWLNILSAGGHVEYVCVDNTDQKFLKWDYASGVLSGTPFNY